MQLHVQAGLGLFYRRSWDYFRQGLAVFKRSVYKAMQNKRRQNASSDDIGLNDMAMS